MPRSPLAYLSDIVEACDAVAVTLKGVDLGAYESNRIVGFRNQLVHDYAAIIDATVWAIASHDAPVLRSECAALIEELLGAD
ncbi:MAG: HepT-like ribonuclease domain-containing protein [Thermoleophilia bacterium]